MAAAATDLACKGKHSRLNLNLNGSCVNSMLDVDILVLEQDGIVTRWKAFVLVV